MHKIKGFLITICLISTLALVLCGCGKSGNISRQNNETELPEIVIGSDNYPPYNYIDVDGNPTGIDVELATEAFSRMGYKARFIYIDWEDKKNLLAKGTIDCAWGSFSMDGREDEYRWAGPYMVSRQVVAVNMNSDIYSLADLEGKTLAVQTTTKPEEIFLNRTDERIPAIRSLISLQKRELIYPFLSKGYADGLAAHETAIYQYMKDYNIQFRILDEPLQVVGLGVAFDKNDTRGIENELTETLRQMKDDGTEKNIISKYLDDAEQYLEVDNHE
ncbi:MAG: transporter substrate-binding domain-containing protein [Eubacteriales bacterium]|nr:transporter substrate-binding domain-containing protein [Eubacteriales bacterium]